MPATIAHPQALLDALEVLRPNAIRALPLDLTGAVFTGGPMTNGNQLTGVVELRPQIPQPSSDDVVSFNVLALRAIPGQPVLDGDPVTQRVTLPRRGGVAAVRFQFPAVPDDGQWAYLLWVDSSQEFNERSENNFYYVYGPAWPFPH